MKSLIYPLTIICFLFVSSSFSFEHPIAKRGVQVPVHRKHIYIPRTKNSINHNRSNNISISDWNWLIDGSMSNIEDVLNVNFEKHLSIFNDYDYVTNLFNEYALKKWNDCSKFEVAKSGYTFTSTFDSKGNVTSYDITDVCKYAMTYNNDNLPTEWSVEEWDTVKNVWWPYKYNSTYNSNKKLETFTITFKENDVWLNWEKFDLTYTSDNNLETEIYCKWNFTSSAWDNKEKWVFSYTNDGDIKEDLGYLWDSTAKDWSIKNSKSTYELTSNKKINKYNTYLWDKTSSDWKIERPEFKYEYDNNGNIISEESYSWDEKTEIWSDIPDKYTFAYNSDNNFTEEIHNIWNATSSEWKPGEYKYTYTYGDDKNITENIDFVWDAGSNKWVKDYKYEFEYKSTGIPEKCIRYSYDKSSNEWTKDDQLDITLDIISKINSDNTIKNVYSKGIVKHYSNKNGYTFIVSGKPELNENMKIFSLQGKIIAKLKPERHKDATYYNWSHTSIQKSFIGNQLFIYSIKKGNIIYSNKLLR